MLEQEIEDFLQQGGEVKSVPRGLSANPGGQPPSTFAAGRLFTEPRESRTPVPEVVAAIEERRALQRKRTATPRRSRLPQPRRKVVYDDFGEPLRRVWIED